MLDLVLNMVLNQVPDMGVSGSRRSRLSGVSRGHQRRPSTSATSTTRKNDRVMECMCFL